MTDTTKPFTIQAGKRYNTHGSEVVIIMHSRGNLPYKFYGSNDYWYTEDGSTYGEGLDLISEHVEQEPTAASVTDEWGPLIGWNGGEWNIGDYEIVQVTTSAGICEPCEARELDLSDYVIAYRIKKKPEVREAVVWIDALGAVWDYGPIAGGREAIITLTNGKPSIRWAD